jgi:hypothetical protein
MLVVNVEDHTREYESGEGELEREDISIVMKKDPGDGDDVFDLQPQNYDALEKYVKRALKIRARDKIKMVCLVPYGEGHVMCVAPPSIVRCSDAALRCACCALNSLAATGAL